MSKFELTPITGLPQVDGWAQVISHPSGSLFCVLAIQGQNANSVGRNLAELLINQEIKNSAELHNLLLDLLQTARTELCKVQLACLVFAQETKVIAATHSGSVFLKRNNKVGEILQSTGELKIIEGNLQANDLFSIVTEASKDNFNNLKEKLQQNIESLATTLVSELQEKQNSSLVAAGFLEEKIAPEIKKVPAKFNQEVLTKKFNLLKEKLNKINLRRIFHFSKRILKKPNFLTETVNVEQNKNQQLFLKLAFIMITIFVGIIFWKQQNIKKELEPIQPILDGIEERFQLIKNDQVTSQTKLRDDAKMLLRELEDLITTNKDKKYSLEEIKKEYQKIQTYTESISGVENQGKLDPFFDLRLTEPEFVAKKITFAGGKLFALDASGKYGIFLELASKKTSKFPLDALTGEAKAVTLNEDYLFVLGSGLASFDLTNQNNYLKLKDEGDSDRGGTLFQSYGAFIYIFNPEKRNIYRYTLKDDKLSEPIGWLIDKQDLDFSAVTSMAIDGDLWLTSNNGQIFKYTQGQKQPFEVKNAPNPLGKNIKISTNETNNYLYVLDKDSQKVVILQKDGLFVKEVNSESLSSGDNIVALDNQKGALIISGSLVYEIFP